MATTVAPPRAFEQAVLDFLAYLEFERGLSRNTLEAYRADLLQFGAYLRENSYDALERRARRARGLPDRAGARICGAPPVAAATLQRKAACLRSFYRHLRREGTIAHDPTAELRGPRKHAAAAARCSPATRSTACSARPQGTSPPALRDRALLELLYACGLRASEAVGLDARATSTSTRSSCARAARAPRSGSCRSAARRVAALRAYLTRGAAGARRACEPSATCSSTAAAARSRRQGLYKIVQGYARRASACAIA